MVEIKQFLYLIIIAIPLSDESDFDELLAVIETFTECGKFQEAHGLYVTLMNRFPHVSYPIFYA